MVDAIHDGKINGMYILGENPAMSDPDQKHARQSFAMLDHLVVQDIFLTETAWHADVVLPASAHAEKFGTYSNTNRQVQMGRPVLDPPGEARQDWEIVTQLANRIGLDWTYQHPKDVFAEMAQVMPSLANITWDRLEREDVVTYPCKAPDQPGEASYLYRWFPDRIGTGKDCPDRSRAARRIAGCGISVCSDDGPSARTLAYRCHDPPRFRRLMPSSQKPFAGSTAGT